MAAPNGMYLFRREFQRQVWTTVGLLLGDLCPVKDTVDFPVNLLLFFIIGISVNLPENGYEVGKASWPPRRDLLLQGLHPQLEWKCFLSAGIQSGLVSRVAGPWHNSNIDLNRSPLFFTLTAPKH